MMNELKSSQLIQYKKLLKTVIDGIEAAIVARSGLIEYDSVTKYEKALYDCNQDPEPYYHLKMFDKAVGIVRLYYPREWFSEDPDQKYYHFAIRCYNFTPSENFNLKVTPCLNYSTYGDFQDINDCFRYFYSFCKELIGIKVPLYQRDLNLEIF